MQTQPPPTCERVFVAERRSNTAIGLGVSWENGRLAAKTLFEALRSAGIDPQLQAYCNLFEDRQDSYTVDARALAHVRALAGAGVQVVAMGRKVQAELSRKGIPFTPLIHPAARGSIRSRERYRAHMTAMLDNRATQDRQ